MLFNIPNKHTSKITALIAALSASGVSLANDLAIEEVVVTAQKRQQSTQEIPGAITAMDSKMLSDSNTTNFSDLGKISSALSISGNPAGTSTIIRIRGVGTNPHQPAIRPAVGIFLDEIPLVSSAAAFTNMADIERIEVLKGPQATLFGKEVSSGAISLFTAQPHTGGVEGFIESTIAEHDVREYRLGGNLPLADNLAVRASAYTADSGSEIENIVTGKQPDSSSQGQRIRLLWEASDNLEIVLGYQHDERDSHGIAVEKSLIGNIERALTPAGTLLEADPYDRKIQSSSDEINTSQTDIYTLRADWLINDELSFNSVTGYQEYDANEIKSKGDGEPGRNPTVGNVDSLRTLGKAREDSLTQEFRFVYEGENLASVIGIFYANSHNKVTTDIKNIAGIIPIGGALLPLELAIYNESNFNTVDKAIFNHNTYTFSDDVELTFGLRYSEVSKEGVLYQPTGAGLFSPSQVFLPGSTWSPSTLDNTWEALTGTLKITYWLNEDISLYAGYDRGFKAGGFNVQEDAPGDVTTRVGGNDFDAEYANNFEMGLKGVGLNHQLRWNTAIFYQTYDDYQVEVQTGAVGIEVQNAATAISQGVEADVMYIHDEHWEFSANVAYVDARYDNYENATCVTPQYAAVACANGSLDLSGKRLNGTSPWTANVSTTYNSVVGSLDWYARAEVAFKDDAIYGSDLDPETHASGYSLVNGSLGILSVEDGWKVVLWGKNLADKDYQTLFLRGRDASQFTDASGLPQEGYLSFIGTGRQFGMDLSYQF